MPRGNLGVQLVQPQMLVCIGFHDLEPERAVVGTTKCFQNEDGDAGTEMSRVKIVQVDGPDRGPGVIALNIQHPTELTVAIQVVVARDKSSHDFAAHGRQGGPHPPIFAGVFPSMKEVEILQLHRPQPMTVLLQHGAKIAVPSGT